MGPVELDLIVRGIRAGKVPVDSLVLRAGESNWRELVDVVEFAEALGSPNQETSEEVEEVSRVLTSPSRRAPARDDEWFLYRAGETAGPVAEEAVVEWIRNGLRDGVVRRGKDAMWSPLHAHDRFARAIAGEFSNEKAAAWFLRIADADTGPYRESAVFQLIREGMVDCLIRREDRTEWTPLAHHAPFAECLFQRRQPGDSDPGWHIRRRGQVAGPHDEALIKQWIQRGVMDFEIARPGSPHWLPLTAHPPFYQALYSAGGGGVTLADIVIVIACLCAGVVAAFVIGPTWLILVIVAALVYLDARVAGVSAARRPGGFLSLNAVGWAVAVGLIAVIAVPAYLFERDKLKTRPGSPLLFLAVIAAAAVLALVVAGLVFGERPEGTEPDRASVSGVQTGIPECDAYLERMARCFTTPQVVLDDQLVRATAAAARHNAATSPADRAESARICREAPTHLPAPCPGDAPAWNNSARVQICNSLAPLCPGE